MRYGVSISKSFLWRGITEQFANVYHYNLATSLDATMADNLVTQLVAAEKPLFSGNVSFETARVWEAGGSPAANLTILIKDLPDVGTGAVVDQLYRELAVVVKWSTNRLTSTGRKIFLRKYLHVEALPSTVAGVRNGTTALTSGLKAPFLSYADTIREIAIASGPTVFLCAPGGQQVSDSLPTSVDDWLRIRQFRG